MRLFLDASAFLKHYIDEPGSSRVRHFLGEADELVLSVIVWPEILSALNRLRRERVLDDEDYAVVKARFQRDLANAIVVALTVEVLQETTRCLERAPLRASDAIHVASALEAGAGLFVSADRRQCEAAKALGLTVEAIPSEGPAP